MILSKKWIIQKRPLSIFYYVNQFPSKMSKIIFGLLLHPQDTCYLVEKGSFQKVWSEEYLGKKSLEIFQKDFIWDRGLIRNVFQEGKVEDIFVTTAQVPILQNDYLESCSGKGMTLNEAKFLAATEALERYSAFLANDLAPENEPSRIEKIPLGSFSNLRIKEDYGYIKGIDAKTKKDVLLPASLIPFPNVNENKKITGSTSGLAFHTDVDYAILGGISEVLEKDSLYNNFLTMCEPKQICREEIIKIVPIPKPCAHKFKFIFYDNELDLPIIHCFYLGEGFVSVGSGHSINLMDSIRCAYAEALQCSFRYLDKDRFDDVSLDSASNDWTKTRCHL